MLIALLEILLKRHKKDHQNRPINRNALIELSPKNS